MTAKTRRFGRAGWEISEISFGAWQLGGQWGSVDDAESIKTLHSAFAEGINFVDTAQMYGLGRSEEIVGQSLKTWGADGIRVATKGQPVSWPDASDSDPNFSDLYPRQHLVEQVNGSLRRLGLDRIDLYQLHCWAPDGLRNMEWLETLGELKAAGKIDKIGVSIRDYRPEDGVDLARSKLVDSIQVIYNIFEQEPERELFKAASEGDTAVIARVVLDSGALSGTWTKQSYGNWAEGSVLHTMFREERFGETLLRVEAIKEASKGYSPNLAEVAVRFVLDRPEVSTAILGMSNAKRLGENLSFSDGFPLPAELRDALKSHEWRRNYYA
jgi:aryl-alcohol dehydrogenase-like predicted oxidoreductase